jgi:hypothetical protein
MHPNIMTQLLPNVLEVGVHLVLPMERPPLQSRKGGFLPYNTLKLGIWPVFFICTPRALSACAKYFCKHLCKFVFLLSICIPKWQVENEHIPPIRARLSAPAFCGQPWLSSLSPK